MTLQVPSDLHDLAGYLEWLSSDPAISLDAEYETYYDNVLASAQRTIGASPFWASLGTELPNIDARFQIKTGFRLLPGATPLPRLEPKPYQSFLEKTYRKNVLHNSLYPAPPAGGWVLPNEWFEQVHDLVRATLYVRYLDGVEVLADALLELCTRHGIHGEVDFEAREEGYYAAHFLAGFECELPPLSGWETEMRVITLELHIATQVQEVLQGLLHPRYQRRRLQEPAKSRERWQWNYKSSEFRLNYLGHISHYVDGMIVGLRDEAPEAESEDEEQL